MKRIVQTTATAALALAMISAAYTTGHAAGRTVGYETGCRQGIAQGHAQAITAARNENHVSTHQPAQTTTQNEKDAWVINLDELDYVVWDSDVTAYFVMTDGTAVYWDDLHENGGNRLVTANELCRELPGIG